MLDVTIVLMNDGYASTSIGPMEVFYAAGRMWNVLETALILYFLGGERIIAAAVLSLGSSQMVGWLFSFVPMGAGTAEGGAYVVFRAAGLSPDLGVLVEIGRKLRRIVFITLGVLVLGWDAFRTQRRTT